MLDYELRKIMRQTVYEDPIVSRTTAGYAVASYSTDLRVTHSHCRIEEAQQMVRCLDGTEQVAKTMVYVGSTATLATSSRFTLPDGTAPQLLSLASYPDENGVTYYSVLYFGGLTRRSPLG